MNANQRDVLIFGAGKLSDVSDDLKSLIPSITDYETRNEIDQMVKIIEAVLGALFLLALRGTETGKFFDNLLAR